MISMMPKLRSTLGPHFLWFISRIWHTHDHSLLLDTLFHLTCRVWHSPSFPLNFLTAPFLSFLPIPFHLLNLHLLQCLKTPWLFHLLHSLSDPIQDMTLNTTSIPKSLMFTSQLGLLPRLSICRLHLVSQIQYDQNWAIDIYPPTCSSHRLPYLT